MLALAVSVCSLAGSVPPPLSYVDEELDRIGNERKDWWQKKEQSESRSKIAGNSQYAISPGTPSETVPSSPLQIRVHHKAGGCSREHTPASGFSSVAGESGCCVVGELQRMMKLFIGFMKCEAHLGGSANWNTTGTNHSAAHSGSSSACVFGKSTPHVRTPLECIRI
jgi:hypothetical protein